MAGQGSTVARLRVEFLGDLSGYREGLKQAKVEGDAASRSLGQVFRDALSKAPVGGWLPGLKQDLELGRSRTAILRDVVKGLKNDFAKVSVSSLHAGLNGLKTVLGSLRGLAADVFKGFSIGVGIGSFQALGRGISDLVNIIPDLIQRGRDYSRTVDDIADATGATTAQAAKFTSTLMFLGQTTGGVINMLGQMSRNLDEQGPILNKLGVATTDANGATLNQIQILDNARSAMVKWGLGTEQANQIAREFGRGGLRTLVDYLHLTDEQFKAITADAQASGLILTDAQRDLGESMIREEARFQNALTGLGETIFTVVGPQIRAFMSQLSDTIQAHVTEISQAISNAISFVLGLVTSLVGASASLDSFAASIQAANVVNSPYGAHLLQLRVEMGELELATKKTTDATGGQRRGIQANIEAIDAERAALTKFARAQDIVYERRLRAISAALAERLATLDAAEAARELASQQHDLNEQLNEAQLALARAKRGSGGIVDAEAVSDAMSRIADIQKRQRELAHDQDVAAQRKGIENAAAYVESVAKLVTDSENRKATAVTLARRKAILETQLAAAKETGSAEAVANATAKLEAVKTAIEQNATKRRNEGKATELDRRKKALQDELSAVRSTAVDATAIRKAEIDKQIKDLEKLEAAWKLHMGNSYISASSAAAALNGKGGLTEAMQDARDAGIEFGKQVRKAIDSIISGLKGIIGTLDAIGKNPVFKFLFTDVSSPPHGAPGGQGGPGRGSTAPNSGPSFGGGTYNRVVPGNSKLPGVFGEISNLIAAAYEQYVARPLAGYGGKKIPLKAEGGWLDKPGLFFGAEHGREYVLDNALSEKLNAFLNMSNRPMAPSTQGYVHNITVQTHLDGRKIAETVSRIQDRQLKR